MFTVQRRYALISVVVSLVACPMLPAADVFWTGNGFGDNWSDDDNWSSVSVPNSADDVFHLIGGTIVFDSGLPIRSFTFAPVSGAGLALESGTSLNVATEFKRDAGSSSGLYALELKQDAELEIGSRLEHVDAVLREGTAPNETRLNLIFGQIVNSRVTSETNSAVLASSIDLTGATGVTKDWTIAGFLEVKTSVLGGGKWTIGAGQPFNPAVLDFEQRCELEVLTVEPNGRVLSNAGILAIDEELIVTGNGAAIILQDGWIETGEQSTG